MKISLHLPNKLSYTWKIMLSIIVIFLIPLLLMGIYIYNTSITSLQAGTIKEFKDYSSTRFNEIEKKVNEIEDVANKIRSNPYMTSYFERTNYSDSEIIDINLLYLDPLLEWINQIGPLGSKYRIFTTNTAIVERDWILHAQQYEKEKWYKNINLSENSAMHWEGFQPEKVLKYSKGYENDGTNSNGGNRAEASVYAPLITNLTNSHRSTLEVYTDIKYILNPLINNSKRQDIYFVAFASDNNIIYSSSGLSTELKEVARSVRIMNSPKNQKRSTYGVGRTDYIFNVATINRLKYTIVAISSLNDILKPVKDMRNIFIGCFLIVSIILLMLSYIFSRNLTIKIKQILKAMNRVQQGDLNTRVLITGKDEISEIGQDFNAMVEKIRNLIECVYKAEILHKEARINAMENQINPHFLYNTLETIKMLAEINRQREISDALTALGMMTRYNLTKGSIMVKVSDELEQVRNYCSLQNLLMNGRLTLELCIEESILSCKIPRLTLQPLIENAITHGFDNFLCECKVKITGKMEEEIIVIIVEDNGKGISKTMLSNLRQMIFSSIEAGVISERGTGIGLKNIHWRIRLKFGERYGLQLDSTMEKGTRVVIRMPKIEDLGEYDYV